MANTFTEADVFSGTNSSIEKYLLNNELRYSVNAINSIALIQQWIYSELQSEYIINVNTGYISPVLYPIFWSILPLTETWKKRTSIRVSGDNLRFKNKLLEHGVINFFENNSENNIDYEPGNEKSIALTKVTANAPTQVIVEKIVNLLPVNMSDRYKNKLISKLYEIFINAQTHSKTIIPVHAIGYTEGQKFYFSAYDGGIGIPKNVRQFLTDEKLDDEQALRWALEDSHSTANIAKDTSRGAGLGVIRQFVMENRGIMMLVSGDCVYRIRNGKKTFHKLSTPIIGTFFSLCIRVDKSHIYDVDKEDKYV